MSPTSPDACVVEILESPNSVFPVTPQALLNQTASPENSQRLSGGNTFYTQKSRLWRDLQNTEKEKKRTLYATLESK